MANLSVRKLDENVYQQLQMRAMQHGVSMEEEVRQIIHQAVATPDNIANVFKKHFGEKNGVDLKIPKNQRKPHDPIHFNEHT
jgi:plasmid stability protein